jgi:uncharacterized protein
MTAKILLGLGIPALIVLVLYTIIAFKAASSMIRAKRRRPRLEDDLSEFQTVRFRSRGDAMYLAASYLQAPNAQQAVILVHGRDVCRGWEFGSSSLGLVARLLEHGYSVMLIDLRGHGESEAAHLTYGLKERLDVLGAVDWLLDRGFQPGQIGVIGASMGGVSAMLAAAEEPAIAAVVSDSAFADFGLMMRARFQRLSGLPNVFLPGVLLAGWVLTGVHLNSLKPAEVAARVQAKMLVIHSASDSWIPKHHALALAAATGAETWITPGKKHLASFREHPEEYAVRVIAFLEQHLKPMPQGMRSASLPNKPATPMHPDGTLVHADSLRHLQP